MRDFESHNLNTLTFEDVLSIDENAPNNPDTLSQKTDEELKEDKIDKVIRGISRVAYSSLAFFVLSTSLAEYSKRESAESEYLKAKELLKEYVIEHNPETYENQYNQAVEKFGEHNLGWCGQGKFNQDTAFAGSRLREWHDNRGNLFRIFYDRRRSSLMTNDYLENFKGVQYFLNINMGNGGKGQDSLRISSPVNVNIGFRDNNDPSKFDTLSESALKKIVYETYPKNWFLNEVASIALSDNKAPKYDTSSYAKNSVTTANFNSGNEHISFFEYKRFYEQDPKGFFEVLSHEAAHANAWGQNEDLSSKEGLKLLLDVSERLNAKDRFISEYVEEIVIAKDPKDNLYKKATEYWAEICGEYFTNGKANLSPKDVELIEGVVKVKDPDFNVDESINKRVAIIHKDVYQESPEQVRELTKMIELKSLLEKKVKERNDFYNKHSKAIEEHMLMGMFTYEPSEDAKNPILDEYARLESQIGYSIDAINEASSKYYEKHKQNSLLDAINSKYEKL